MVEMAPIDEKIQQLDYEPLKSVKPVLKKNPMTIYEIRYEVEPHWSNGECETSATARLYWDWHNKEWVAKVDGQWFQDYPKGRTWLPFTAGEKFRLNESACRKLLEAYNIPEPKLAEYGIGSIMSAAKISPRKLERLGKK
jgi:hypothetical protein